MTQPDPSALSGAPEQTGALSGAGAGGEGAGTTPPETGGAPSGTTTTEPTAETVSKADFDRVVNQLRAADQKREQRERELQQIRDKDLPEIDKLKRDTEALVAERDRLSAQVKTMAVENAFLKENSVKWRDADAALKLADMSDVVINDDGTVTGLKIAMEKLAKAKPYLVEDAAPPQEPAKGGGAPPMNGQPGTSKTDTGGLANRIPALRTRMRPQRPS